MAPDEEMLEKLYELLTLYFEISPHGGLVKTFDKHFDIEPTLDYILLKEELLARITDLLIGGDNYV